MELYSSQVLCHKHYLDQMVPLRDSISALIGFFLISCIFGKDTVVPHRVLDETELKINK